MNESLVPKDSQPTVAMDQQIQADKKTKIFQWLTPKPFAASRSSIEPEDDLWLAWAVLACALALTFVAWRGSLQDIESQLRHEFEAEVSQVRSDLGSRLAGYTQTLRAAAALFASSDEVTREEWHTYVAGLRLEQSYPAIQAMAFARAVNEAELDRLVKDVRNTGVADFAVRPPGQRDTYVVNVFAEPYTGLNIQALGYDMWQDADRRETMQRASQADAPMITSRITLKVDEQSQPVPAFIMYMPVRRKPGDAVLGYVLSPFRMPVLMDDLLKNPARTVSLTIHDGSESRPDNVFYRSAEESSSTAKFTYSEPLLVGGRTWTLSYASRAQPYARAGISPASKVLAVGLLTGVLLFGLVGSLVNTRGRAVRLARSMTRSLRESEENLKITLLSIGDAVIATDRDGRITRMNPVAERLSGWLLADARDRPLVEVFHIVNASTRQSVTDPVQLVMARGEVVGLANHTLLLARDGCEYQIADSAAPIRNAAGDMVGVVLVFSDVTEKYRVEKALHLSRFSLDAASDFIFWVTPDARMVDVNAAACRSLGYTREELLELRVSDVDTHYNAEVWPEHFVQLRQHGSMMFESEFRARDGRLFPVEIVANYIDYDGEERSCAFIRDISERKRVEKGLNLTQFTVDAASDAMFWIAPDARIVDVNAAACRSLGYTREELLQLHVSDVDTHYNAEVWPEHFVQLRQLGSLTFESEHRRKDGGLFPVEIVANLIAHDGEDLNCAFIRDITKRKQAEAKIKLAASVFSNAREAIMITDVQGTILDVNESFTRITGYVRDEVIGNNPRILSSGRQDKAFYAAVWRELLANGHWSGELWNRRKDGGVFAEMLTISAVRDSLGNTVQYVALFSDITAIKEHQRKLEHIAHFDALTDLPNRVLLADRLQQAMVQTQRRGQQLAVVYLDLDGFKAINDKHGHGTGDQILTTLAKRMKQALREADTLARLGGDEFVAVLIDLEDVAASAPLLIRLLAAAAQPVPVDGLSLQVSASLGVTFYPQAQDVDADQLLRQADHAMYQAKVAGKNRYLIFDAVQDSSLRVHHESLENIRLALERGEFVLHYQPKVNMRSGQVIGAEALIRWQHPAKGLLAPAAFLPVIENHPLSVAIGEWVIDTALTQVEMWRASGLDIPVSVNIGARQLQQFNFVERLQAMLVTHPHVAPDCLELEVLETSALEDIGQVSQVIEACAEIGVLFALDDFGTGYSSLTYLKRLRVALLKIDQSFVRDMLDDPDDLAILQGVIGLAAAFRRQVIAEGVETVAHGTLLLQLGCDLAQGYGIARPMPADQLPEWAQTWRPDPSWSGMPDHAADHGG